MFEPDWTTPSNLILTIPQSIVNVIMRTFLFNYEINKGALSDNHNKTVGSLILNLVFAEAYH